MSWNGVKKQTNIEDIKAWCDEMGVKNYTINSKGEIDVDGDVSFTDRNIKELPYKFGAINGFFSLTSNPNITSLKNCPNKVESWFSCDDCVSLDSLEGCPKKVRWNFYCNDCKREFTEEEVRLLCDVKMNILV